MIGTILFILGIGIKVYALVDLKASASWRIQSPGKLVKTGAYKYIRHPIYLGELIAYFGLSLLITKDLGISFLFFITVLKFFLDRIDREENFLAVCFSDEYVEYFRRTKMLIPFLL